MIRPVSSDGPNNTVQETRVGSLHLRVIASKDFRRFRVQYRHRFLFWTYWVDTNHVRMQGRKLAVIYPSREMATDQVDHLRNIHLARSTEFWP